jgi:hypothetical protein
MTVLSALRERFSPSESTAGPAGDADGDPVAKARLPFDGYDRLNAREVTDGLSDHTQIELEAVESYERSHQDREQVLAKLRWMRGSEPFAGYDALTTDEIVTTLGEADMATIKKVRAYERKFANRRDVMEAVVRVHHRGLASQPAKAAPAYVPTSYE